MQNQIDSILQNYGPGKPMPEGVITLIMYLMQEYGVQVTGLDAGLQSKVNQFFDKVHDLYAQLDAANGQPTAANESQATSAFLTDIANLSSALTSDGFFTSGAGSGMVQGIESALDTLKTLASKPGGLEALWQEYNGASSGAPSSQVGNPTDMNTMTMTLGQLTQQYTGLSKSVQAQTQSDASQLQTEQDTLNSFLKKLNSTILYMLQQQKTQ